MVQKIHGVLLERRERRLLELVADFLVSALEIVELRPGIAHGVATIYRVTDQKMGLLQEFLDIRPLSKNATALLFEPLGIRVKSQVKPRRPSSVVTFSGERLRQRLIESNP
jgi:hypothetical protein